MDRPPRRSPWFTLVLCALAAAAGALAHARWSAWQNARALAPARAHERDTLRGDAGPASPRAPDAAAALPPGFDPPPAPAAPRAFRLDPQHTGRSGYVLPRAPRVLARVTTAGRINAQAAVAPNGRVVFGSHDGVLYAAEADTGRVSWRVATGDRIYASPLIDPATGTVFVGSDADRVFAVNPNGTVHVALATDDDADTAPARAPDGSLRFAAGRALYAVEPDLTVRWRLEFGGKVFSSPAVTPDGTTIVGCQDDAVYAVAGDGAVLWRVVTGGDVDATPAVDAAGTVYIGSDDGSVYAVTGPSPAPAGADGGGGATAAALDAGRARDAGPGPQPARAPAVGRVMRIAPARGVPDAGALAPHDAGGPVLPPPPDGVVLWRRPLGGYVRAGVALGLDGALVVGTYGPRPRVVALDRATGAERWAVPVPGPPTRDYGVASAALVDREGRYAIGTPDDALWLLSREGHLDARVSLPADVDAPPVLIADGLIVVGCDDGVLYVIGD